MAQKHYQLQSVPLVTTKRRCVKMMNVLSPCLAGLDPASHSVKQVGTQRVALDRDSMGLRVKPAKTQAHFDTPPLFFSTQQMVG